MLRDLLTLESNFIICTELKRVSNETANSTIRGAQKHFYWSQWVSDIPSVISMVINRGKRENVIADKSALNDMEDLDGTLARINNGGEYLGEFSFTVVLYGWKSRAELHAVVTDVAKIVGNYEGALVRETYNALNAYLSIIPGNDAFNLRRTWLLNGNYADLSFLYAPHKGETVNRHLREEHLVVLETNHQTLYYFNLHDGDRLGALIFGGPGSGKSVLTNLFIDHSQKHAPRTFILDLGGSYRQITRKHGGSYVEMQFGCGKQSFRINPFVLPNTADKLHFLFTFVRLLLSGSERNPRSHDDRELFEAIEGMYVLDAEHRTLGNLATRLPQHLADSLHPWVGTGQYGSLFDNPEDTLTFAEFQTFDFQGLDEVYPQVLQPLLFYIFQRISQIVYNATLASTYKQLWADEVWRFLANDTARAYLVSAGKTWRKHNGGIGLVVFDFRCQSGRRCDRRISADREWLQRLRLQSFRFNPEWSEPEHGRIVGSNTRSVLKPHAHHQHPGGHACQDFAHRRSRGSGFRFHAHGRLLMDPRTERMIRNDVRSLRSPIVIALCIFIGAIILPLLIYFGGAIDRFLGHQGFLH